MREGIEPHLKPFSSAERNPSGTSENDRSPDKLPLSLYLIEAYLFFDYIRPHQIIPGLEILHLPLILTIALALLVLPRILERFSDRLVMAFGLLLLLMVFHGPVAVNNFWALSIFLDMLHLFIVYLAITQVVTTMSRLRHLMLVWLLIHLILALYAITHGGRGPAAFTADENDLALVIVMVVPLPFFLLLAPKPSIKKPFLLGLLCLFLGVVFATFSRGGFLGLLAVSFYCLWRTPRKIISGLALAICVLLASFMAPPEYGERIRSIWGEATGDVSATGADREYTWKVGFQMFLGNPLFGVGQGNFPWTFSEYEGESGFRERSFAGRAAHSIYFTIMPELGLVGTLIFLYMVRLLWGNLSSVRNRIRGPSSTPTAETADLLSFTYALQAALIGYLVSGAFISVLYYPPFWLLLAFSTSLKRIAVDLAPDHSELSEASRAHIAGIEPGGEPAR